MSELSFYEAIDWAKLFCGGETLLRKGKPGSEQSKAAWNEKAPSFAHKPVRSGYIAQLIEAMDLEEGETVFDMGCGPGTLAVPLARQGHSVCAVDFSDAMLAELERACAHVGVPHIDGDAMAEALADVADLPAGTVVSFHRSWQQGWEGLPVADRAIASRSLIVDDLADALGKMEAHAHKSVAVTVGAGDLPNLDARIFRAMGRDPYPMLHRELIYLVNYLLAQRRPPKIAYLSYPGRWHRQTRDELEKAIRLAHAPKNDAEEAALDAYLNEHVRFSEEHGDYELDYLRDERWAYVEYDVVN